MVSEPTVYNGSGVCPKCKILLNPVEELFSGPTQLCVNCRNAAYEKQAKSAMGGR